MISPRDAFRQFNIEQNGKLTFEQFTNFTEKLCQLSGSELYPYSVIQDLYDFIDIRKDGVIDLNEWLHSFQTNPAHSMQTQTSRSLVSRQRNHLSLDINENQGNDWELAPSYDKIMYQLGKNRKHLITKFTQLKIKGIKIDKNIAKNVISELLREQRLEVSENQWPYLLKFAERDGEIDYKFLLEVYKGKLGKISSHPCKVTRKL